MVDVDRCQECGIPTQTVESHEWLNSGVIVRKDDSSLRMAFVECENLDPLFDGIVQIIGVPIEHIVIDCERKGNRDYCNPTIPQEVKDLVRKGDLPLVSIIDAMTLTASTNGLGRFELKDESLGEFITVISYDAHSVPITLGDIAGGCEAVMGDEYSRVTYKELSPHEYEMTAMPSGFPANLEGRLERKEYHLREGDIELERCSTCGGPLAFSRFKWDLDMGTIKSDSTGRRVGIVYPPVLDPIFGELEKELGETIAPVVLEAQRRFTKTGFYSVNEIKDVERFRNQLALLGMGNLREFKMDPKGLHLSLDNACMHLMVVGMIQGLYEIAFDKESSVEWELSEEGDLHADVTPLFTQFLSAS
jgi:hypothetical protein